MMAVPDIGSSPRPLGAGWSFLEAAASSAAQKRKAAQDLRCPVKNCKLVCEDERELDEHIIKAHPRSQKAVSAAKARLQKASPRKSARSPKARRPSGVVGIAIDLEADVKPADATQAIEQDAVRGGYAVATPPAQLDEQARKQDAVRGVCAVATPPAQLDEQVLKKTPPLTAGQASGQDAVCGGCVVAAPPAHLDQQAADGDVASDVATVPGTPPLSSSKDRCLPAQEEAADADIASDVATVPGTPPRSSSKDGCLPAQEEAHAAAPEAKSGNDILDDGSDDDLLEACRLVEAKVGGTLGLPVAPAPLVCNAASETWNAGNTQPTTVLKVSNEETHPPNGAPVAFASAAPAHPFDQADVEVADIDAMLRDEEMMEQEMAFEAEAAAEAQFQVMVKETPPEKKPASTVQSMFPSGGSNASPTAGDGKCLTCGLYGHPTGSCLQKTRVSSFGSSQAPQLERPTAVHTTVECGDLIGGASCFKCGRSGHLARECPCKCGYRCRWMGGICQADQGAVSSGGFLASTDETGVPMQASADCFKCGNSGHWAKDCPCTCGYRCQWQGRPCQGASRATGSTQGAAGDAGASGASGTSGATAGRECFKCGNSGHWARDCPCTCGYRCKNMGGPCPMASDMGKPIGGMGSMRETSGLSLTSDFAGLSGGGLSTSGTSGRASGEAGCFKCGQLGHWASACTAQASGAVGGGAGGGRPSSGGGCFRCGQEGHWASQCPLRG